MQYENALVKEVIYYCGSTEEGLNRLGECSGAKTYFIMFHTDGEKR